MKRLILSAIAAASLGCAVATTPAQVDFDKMFNDSTLRIDYIFGADSTRCTILTANQSVTPGWYGRRHSLEQTPLRGNGCITIIDAASADTIYRLPFSALFLEWVPTDERFTTRRSFENSFIMPQPKGTAYIDIELFDKRRQSLARDRFTYRPDDILVGRPDVSSPLPHRYVHRGADPVDAIDVAILAEGYTVEEMDSFYRHAEIAASEILSYEPFCRYADRINFVAVASPSADSGITTPRLGQWRDTPFGSRFSTFYSDRYLCPTRIFAIHDALRGIPYEHIIVLANTEEYGGGGVFNSYTLTAARHKTFRPVVVHEFGHSFGGLADEYFYDSDALDQTYDIDIEPWEPNITTLVDFSSKWGHLIDPSTPIPTPDLTSGAGDDEAPVGVYEGGGYRKHGIYRPVPNCRMRNNAYPRFCPACTDALDRLILFYLGPQP